MARGDEGGGALIRYLWMHEYLPLLTDVISRYPRWSIRGSSLELRHSPVRTGAEIILDIGNHNYAVPALRFSLTILVSSPNMAHASMAANWAQGVLQEAAEIIHGEFEGIRVLMDAEPKPCHVERNGVCRLCNNTGWIQPPGQEK